MIKTRPGYFFWILALAFALMGLIVAAQIFTKKNITGLKMGNQDAVTIFAINNRFEELVNLSFELNTKITSPGVLPLKRQSLIDSLNSLGYNASVLQKLGMQQETKAGFENLNRFINIEVEMGHTIINADPAKARRLADSLGNQKIADSIYNAALSIQKFLEKDMQSALDSNAAASTRLSGLNKTLALVAIAAILILCAIIINRHIAQVRLIKELEKATAAATESALIKEQFLANMSHEIRTPLNAIKGFSRLLSLTPLNAEQKEYAGIINESSSNLLIIVNDILDISKIEANKLRIENKPFDLKRLMSTLKGMFRKQAEDKGLQYLQSIADNVPFSLKGDPDRLLQILINLAGNAIKFTTAGKVEVLVQVHHQQKNKVIIDFDVVDTGVGIPDDKKHIIFTRFEQLQNTEGDLIHGTGLGLSIVKNLAALMNGSVSVSSQNGKGARFNLRLPFEILQNSEQVVSEQKHLTSTEKPVYSNATLLVIEDNNINQLLVKKILADTKATVTVASNGQEALTILSKQRFDLIFLDIQMPVMDGYTAAKKMREMRVQTPVVAMTAFAMPGEKQKCLDAGMNDYIAKPIEAEKVYEVLATYLNPTRQGDEEDQLDISSLLKLTDGDYEMVDKILLQIAAGIPEMLHKLNQQSNAKQLTDIKSLCHYMLSSYAPIGEQSEIVRLITETNKAATDGNLTKTSQLIPELEKQLLSLRSQIDKRRIIHSVL